jgi:hypothetical protein
MKLTKFLIPTFLIGMGIGMTIGYFVYPDVRIVEKEQPSTYAGDIIRYNVELCKSKGGFVKLSKTWGSYEGCELSPNQIN